MSLDEKCATPQLNNNYLAVMFIKIVATFLTSQQKSPPNPWYHQKRLVAYPISSYANSLANSQRQKRLHSPHTQPLLPTEPIHYNPKTPYQCANRKSNLFNPSSVLCNR